jgi:CheY-like chemotaxis protein
MTSKRILVIDNEEYIREVTQLCLETVAGWTVITAGSGTEGIIKAEAEQPDAILLDVMMPEMDGIATFELLQANAATQNIPVILLTAKVQGSERYQDAQARMMAAIAKPFNPLQLANQVAAALGWTV